MGLLRACADVILIGSGTLRASPTSLWAPERVYPAAAEAYAALRKRMRAPSRPGLAIVTAGGEIDTEHPALAAGALVLTTAHGAARLEGRLPPIAEILPLPGEHEVDLRAAIDALHARGYELILSEAGPSVMGSLLAAGLVDEIFLTVSPVLAGRSGAVVRPGLVEGRELLPETRVAGRLTGVRRHGQHLFLRYDLRSPSTPDPAP
jgi:riboflavin biosynthesis pyrimidine reductase